MLPGRTTFHAIAVRRPLPIPTLDEFLGLSKLLQAALGATPGAVEALHGARRHFGWNLLASPVLLIMRHTSYGIVHCRSCALMNSLNCMYLQSEHHTVALVRVHTEYAIHPHQMDAGGCREAQPTLRTDHAHRATF